MASHSLHNACVRCLGLRYFWGFGAAGTDALNDRIRRLRSDGSVVTLVGSDYSFADGKTKDARFNSPVGVALLGDEIIVADCGNNCTDSSSAPRDCPPRASSALACCVLAFCACFVGVSGAGVRRISGEGEVAVLAGRIVPASEARRMRRYSLEGWWYKDSHDH